MVFHSAYGADKATTQTDLKAAAKYGRRHRSHGWLQQRYDETEQDIAHH
jgi:hypothetical protein